MSDYIPVKTLLSDARRLYLEAINSRQRGNYLAVIDLYKRALGLKEMALGPYHEQVAVCANNLGLAYYEAGQLDMAEPYFLRAKEILDTNVDYDQSIKIDPYSVDGNLRNCLHNLAKLYFKKGELSQSLTLYRRLYNMFKAEACCDYTVLPELAEFMREYSDVLRETGRNSESNVIYLGSLGRQAAYFLGSNFKHVACIGLISLAIARVLWEMESNDSLSQGPLKEIAEQVRAIGAFFLVAKVWIKTKVLHQ